MGRLRTVFCICDYPEDTLLDLKFVRGLTLSRLDWEKDFKPICEFRHLRLLHIQEAYIYAFPNSITKLYNLQTLVIKECPCTRTPHKNEKGVLELPMTNML
ncbi:hypothetical protein CFP56_028512 [Quercus suber]|uniref:Uncharacterized protein n=1 Tax=Quercus suber TaxID=58331 RepID=A0AAW0JTX5_QUESU